MTRPTIYLTIALVALVTGFWVLDAPRPQSIASGPPAPTVAPAPTVPELTAVETTSTVAATTTVPASVPLGLTDGATVLATAQRGEQTQLSVPIAPTTTAPGPPTPIRGDCDSWKEVFRHYGATQWELDFFFARGIVWRESRCGLDTINERTGDTGICQINPVHNRAGYFWGREYGRGGWLMALFGLQTRQYTDAPQWAQACLHLLREEGTYPWKATR